MLKIRKAIFDKEGHVNMTLKHLGYDIRVYSRPYTENLFKLCHGYGEFVLYKTHHDDFNNTKAFNARCYDVSNLNIVDEDDWGHESKVKWLIRHEDVSDKTIRDLLSGKIFFYDIHVVVSKYGVGLSSTNSCDDNSDFYKVSSVDTKKDLVDLINRVIAEGYSYARRMERSIFSGANSVDYDSGDDELDF